MTDKNSKRESNKSKVEESKKVPVETAAADAAKDETTAAAALSSPSGDSDKQRLNRTRIPLSAMDLLKIEDEADSMGLTQEGIDDRGQGGADDQNQGREQEEELELDEDALAICLHALAVFHPLSHGNVYHGRVVLEILLNHWPKSFMAALANQR